MHHLRMSPFDTKFILSHRCFTQDQVQERCPDDVPTIPHGKGHLSSRAGGQDPGNSVQTDLSSPSVPAGFGPVPTTTCPVQCNVAAPRLCHVSGSGALRVT